MRKNILASVFVLMVLLMVSAYAGGGGGNKAEGKLPSAEMSSKE